MQTLIPIFGFLIIMTAFMLVSAYLATWLLDFNLYGNSFNIKRFLEKRLWFKYTLFVFLSSVVVLTSLSFVKVLPFLMKFLLIGFDFIILYFLYNFFFTKK